MNLLAIFSKTGKGVQEASGKTSHLSRGDRNVLKEIDGKTPLGQVAKKFEKITEEKFDQLIQHLDKDGFIREVSSGASQPAAPAARPAAPPPRPAPPPPSGGGDDMDFTQAIKLPPKAPAAPKPPPVDLAAAARADVERKAKEQQAFDFKGRQEAEAKAKAEAEVKARAAAEARARQEAEAKAKAAAEARAATEAKALAEADAKVKAAREAAVRMATEAKAKTEAAEGRARKEAEEKTRIEAELKGKLEEERKAREEAEQRAREATEVARRELEEKVKREAEEMRLRLEAEMRVKLEEERRAREEEDRKRREEEERRRKEEDERRAKEEAERRAKEEAERRAREEAERKRREEEDRKRREEDERRRKEDEERRAKEAAERRAREEDDRKRRDDEDRKRREEDERRAKEEAERRAREEQDRKRRDEEDRRRREEAERIEKEEAEARARASQAATPLAAAPAPPPAVPPPSPAAPAPAAQPAAAAGGSFGDSLLADLDSFTQRDEEERKAKEEAESKAKEEVERKAKDEAERRAREEAEKKRREEEERRRKEEEERRRKEEEERLAQEEAEQRAREDEERRKHEEAERKRKAKEALAAKQAEQRAAATPTSQVSSKAAPTGDDDIGVTEDDLDMEDVKRDEKKLGAEARKAARERERAESRTGKDEPVVAAVPRKPVKWGKRAAVFLFVVLIVGVGLLHVMPVSTADYEKAASEAFGAPVKIGSARLSVITGIELRFEGVSVGDTVKIRQVRGFPEIGSLFGAKKAFSRVELEGLSLSQEQLADAVLGKASGENFRIGRVEMKQAKLDGPLALPPLDVAAVVSGDGSLQSVTLRGGDKLSVQLSPKGSELGFEISAGSLALPFVPALTLSDFGMKGTATRQGVTSAEFDGRAFDGLIAGTARIRWGANWSVEGELRVRGVKVGVFAPALVSEGKVEGRGVYGMSGPAPARLFEGARLEGNFKIENGVLGSFDLTRALQTGGAQSGGRTMFAELNGQGLYDKGAMQFRNIAVASGAMNAGASLDIDTGGALSGRIAADVKTPTQTLRATLNISGKIQDPVIRK